MASFATEDDALLIRAAGGDREAFAALARRHGARLNAIAVRMTGNQALAEEIVQETLTRAWKEASRFRPRGEGGGAPAWLARIATNLALDHLRRPRGVPLEAAGELHDPGPGSEALLIAAERRRRLEAAVRALPPRQRAAIALTYDDALSNAEGAAALGVSTGAFELLLVRGRRALRAALADDREG